MKEILQKTNDFTRMLADALLRSRWQDLAPVGRAAMWAAAGWWMLPMFVGPALAVAPKQLRQVWDLAWRLAGLVAAMFIGLVCFHIVRLAAIDLRFRRMMGGDG